MKDLHVPALRAAGLSLILASLALSGAEFYVAPTGDDANPGTRSKPFASLERARDAVRQLKARDPKRDYTVLVRGGCYRLKDTIRFSLEDSAADGHTVTYAAYGSEQPVFSAGVPIGNWTQEGKLWVAKLPESVKPFYTLYDRTGRLPRARSKAFSPTLDYRAAEKLDRFTLPFPTGTLRNWPNVSDVEIMIRPNYAWVLNLLPLASVDEPSGMARTTVPSSYPMVKVRWGPPGINTQGTAWVENTLEALDEPGEWVLNTQERKLYLWPRGDRPEGIEAAQLTELLRVEGAIDYDGPRDQPVRGLVFRGLSFTRGDRWPWEKDRIGLTLQHDWEMFDRPTAMVRLRGAEQVAFERCRWFDAGGAGIRLDLHACSNRVADSTIEHLGGAGIVLAGYGPGTKNVNRRNEILRNHIHHIGEILWHAAGISVWQSGENRVANNLIHDVNYTAITVSGRINWNKEGRGDGWGTIRWKEVEAAAGEAAVPKPGMRVDWSVREPFLHGRKNVVERNDIHDVMQKLWDGDAIYISGTGGGNMIRQNFIHDCLSDYMCEGIRCDDDQNETVIEQNLIYRNGGMGTGIAMKGRNYVLNNFIIDSSSVFEARGLISIEGIPVDGSVIERNILATPGPKLRPFFMKNLLGQPDPHFRETKTDFNLYWNPGNPAWAEAHLALARSEGAELRSVVGDPCFRDPAKGDCRFRAHSAALGLQIRPLDLRGVGLHGSRPTRDW